MKHEPETTRIKVLFIQSQGYFGSDSMIHSLIMRFLDHDRFEVHVACAKGATPEGTPALRALTGWPGVTVRPTNFGSSREGRSRWQLLGDACRSLPFVWDMLRLSRYARRHGVQIVHGTEKPRDSFYGYLIARSCGARSITHLHVKVEDWISPLVRWSMHRNSGLLAVSKFVQDSAISMGYRADRTYYALNAVDQTNWDPETDGSGVRRELGIADETPLLLILSRVFPWKGHEILLRALAVVKQRGSAFHLIVAGEDDPRATPGGGSYLARLKELCTELDLDDRVTFTGFRSDVQALLAAGDIYSMPTFEEPCAVAFLEAMAMGLPIVALRSGGTVQQVTENVNGLLSDPGDVDELASNLERLITDPDLRREFGAASRRAIEEHFTPRRLAADVEAIYEKVLAST